VIQSAFLLFHLLKATLISITPILLIIDISAIIHESPIKPGCDRN